jgi:putative transposase
MAKRGTLPASLLCGYAGVSRSGFYSFLTRPERIPTEDEREIILLHEEGKQLKGYRRPKMAFERKHGRVINVKKVRRIKRQYGLVSRIRKPSKLRAIQKSGPENAIVSNLVRRNFTDPNAILLSADLTEFRIRGGQRAFMFAMKHTNTAEIVAFDVGAGPTMELVLNSVRDYLSKLPPELRRHVILNSDQGFQFTHRRFRNLLSDHGIKQTMSRKVACLGNAPIERFFGHLKDEVHYRGRKTIDELDKSLRIYVDRYNNETPQWVYKKEPLPKQGFC